MRQTERRDQHQRREFDHKKSASQRGAGADAKINVSTPPSRDASAAPVPA